MATGRDRPAPAAIPARARYLIDNAPWLGAGALLTFLSSFGQTFFISIFAGEIMAAFGLSHGGWGALYTLGTAASAIVMIWAGSLTDRWRARALGSMTLAFLALCALAMALNVWVALLPMIIFGLRFAGQGMLSHIAIVAMSRWFVATRGRALAVAGLGFALGEALLPLLFVALMGVVDWRLLWALAAMLCVAVIPVLRRLLRAERALAAAEDTRSAAGMSGRHWQRHEVLRHPLFWVMVPALLGPSAFLTAFFFHQVHFAALKDLSHLELVALFPAYTLLSVASMVLTGWANDRIGTARLMPWFHIPLIASFAILATGSGLPAMMAGLGFLALATGANTVLPSAFWAEFYGTRHLGAIKAMATAIMVAGSAVGPGLTGVLIDAGIPLETQYLGVAAYFTLTTVLMAAGIGAARRDLVPL